ncbi:MAG TPA: glycerol-3-phosphate dehydrogenase/oxidase [Gemmatimonadota bacterium]|nr:glycerol-3-phosphate dehydrogenase/oxidase [Gemmatimonadota bacterium]
MPDAPRTEPWSRAEALERLTEAPFDVVVVGGGVTGAGLARDAALRGLRTALVEAADWAAGTSSRTTKFAHGGLRYLESLDFALVREALAERAVLLTIAPQLTQAAPFLLPVYAGFGRPSWKLRAGLSLYDALAGRTRLGRHHMLDARGALAREPGLRREGLKGAGVYWDARIRDARLVVETVADARRAGAVAANRCAVTGLERWKMGWTVEVEDVAAGGRFAVRGRVVMNATGPWADRLRALVAPDAPLLLAPTKGVHVVVPRAALPLRDPTALFAPDGRLVFAVPEGDWTFLGTTDTADHGAVEDLSVADADVAYLVEAADAALERPLAVADVVGAWAGWRPLVRPASGRRRTDPSREEAIEETAPGLWTVTGGKLTTYRAMAEAALDRAIEAVGWRTRRCATAARPLVPEWTGGEGPPPDAPPSAVARARELFGPDADDVFARWREDPATAVPLAEDFPFTAAEVERAAREMVGSLEDLVDRRLLSLPGGAPVSRYALRAAAGAAAPTLGWDAERVDREILAFR